MRYRYDSRNRRTRDILYQHGTKIDQVRYKWKKYQLVTIQKHGKVISDFEDENYQIIAKKTFNNYNRIRTKKRTKQWQYSRTDTARYEMYYPDVNSDEQVLYKRLKQKKYVTNNTSQHHIYKDFPFSITIIPASTLVRTYDYNDSGLLTSKIIEASDNDIYELVYIYTHY